MRSNHRRALGRAGAMLLILVFAALTPLFAQYFGQNKVRYRSFDFQVLQTKHFDIYYYPSERQGVTEAARMAERWYTRLSRVLNHDLPPHQPVILYDSSPSFRSTTVIPGFIGETTGGVTEGLRRRVILPLAGALAETDHVLGHELVHAFQYSMAAPKPGSGYGGASAMASLPLWFVEGMAEYLSIGPVDPNTALWMRDAIIHNDLPSIKDLNNPKYFPYRYGEAFWAYVGGRFGDKVIGKLLLSASSSGRVDTAIQNVLDMKQEQLSEEWQQALKEQYGPVLRRTSAVDSFAQPLVTDKQNGGDINVSPSISPDGKLVAFFSERSLFAIDLYLADAQTGRVIRKITDTALDPHFDSFQFVNSTGAWSVDSRRFVYPSISDGRPELSIYDVPTDNVTQSFRFDDLGEILHPTWSPDGKQIAFSAIKGGLLDLYVVDLATGKSTRLTDDAFAEMQPEWSPDGKSIAFVTDRFGTELKDLEYGHYQLAMLDVATRKISAVPNFRAGKSINPQWMADGSGLYFLSDQNGISNIYSVSLGSGDLRQITNVQTGITGITDLSPAFSLARGSGEIAFTVLEHNKYNIYRTDAQRLAALPAPPSIERSAAAELPPLKRAGEEIEGLAENPQTGLVSSSGFTSHPYHPHLSLDYIAPPSIGVGITTLGTVVGGGTALYWSDLLGQHNLMTAFQTTSVSNGNFLRNLSATAMYQNDKSRWTWGFLGGQVPYVTGTISQGLGSAQGEAAVVQQSTTFWQIDRQAAGILSYPFNRAQRVEFSMGYENVGFHAENEVQAFSAVTGELLLDQTQDLPSPDTLNMGTASAALVYDTSLFGGTSPLAGRRYRLEFGSRAGSLNYSTGLADFRQYYRVFPHLSLAGRFLHFGRYGGGGEDSRLQELFLGYSTLVRGYDPQSFSVRECGPPTQSGGCPVFDQLFGSRIFVANFEARIPVIGPAGLYRTSSIPPVGIAPFYDAGFAWISEGRAFSEQRARTPVSSYGLTGRVNVLGFFVLQASYVHPNDRPLKKWVWEFGLSEGF